MAKVKGKANDGKSGDKKNVRNKRESSKYINPLTDFGFKHIFGAKASMLDFLNAVLNIEGGIADLTYDNTEKIAHADEDRTARYDLHCTTGTGERVIIEMQNQSQYFFRDRMLYYATFPIQEQAPKGKDWDFKLNPVYSVNITNFRMNRTETVNTEEKYCSYFQLMNTDTKEIFSDKLIFVVLELPLFDKTEDELQTGMDKWMFVLKNLPKLNDLPAGFRNEVFEQLFHTAEIAKLSASDRKEYYRSLKSYRDMNNYITQRDRKIAEQRNIIIGYQQREVEHQQQVATKDKIIAELRQQLSLKDSQTN